MDHNDTLTRLRLRHHPRCFVGRTEAGLGLGVHFTSRSDGSVQATISAPPSWEGYPGLVHGGIIATLLDGALINALFARGTVAVTAELTVRYWRPLPLGYATTVVGQITLCEPPLYVGEARVGSAETVFATCKGKFMRAAEGRPSPED